MYFNSGKGKEEATYDAIVVGSGISGGWAAKELCEKGLKTIVLERGKNIEHITDYKTAMLEDWELPNRNLVSQEILSRKPKQNRTGYTARPEHEHFFVDDTVHPYEEKQRFDWMRGYHVGGRSIMWGRHSYRLSPMDFEANAKDGIAIPWPIGYKDIAPWYDYVESFAGICGQAEGLPQLPDGKFLPPMSLNCLEVYMRERILEKFPKRVLTSGRTANLSVPHNGRGACQLRNRCSRGCPYGAYFSSQSSTLPAAEKTGNLTIRPFSIVYEVIYDDEKGKATGVRLIDMETKETHEYYAKVIFLCASAVASTSILMKSKSSKRFSEGIGAESGELGHNIMDHHFRIGADGDYEGFQDKYYKGRRPNGIYMPRFVNLDEETREKDFIRGYGYQGGASRGGWDRNIEGKAFGAEMKDELMNPGIWSMHLNGFGECLPYHENKMELNYDKTDEWGQPIVVFDASFKENEMNMRKHMQASAIEMLEHCGLENIRPYDHGSYPGLGIHEMGTARMGNSPKSSVLNKYNQVWGAENVYVTDGACMTSSGCQNPSLTYMALTARAADHAVKSLKKGDL